MRQTLLVHALNPTWQSGGRAGSAISSKGREGSTRAFFRGALTDLGGVGGRWCRGQPPTDEQPSQASRAMQTSPTRLATPLKHCGSPLVNLSNSIGGRISG